MSFQVVSTADLAQLEEDASYAKNTLRPALYIILALCMFLILLAAGFFVCQYPTTSCVVLQLVGLCK